MSTGVPRGHVGLAASTDVKIGLVLRSVAGRIECFADAIQGAPNAMPAAMMTGKSGGIALVHCAVVAVLLVNQVAWHTLLDGCMRACFAGHACLGAGHDKRARVANEALTNMDWRRSIDMPWAGGGRWIDQQIRGIVTVVKANGHLGKWIIVLGRTTCLSVCADVRIGLEIGGALAIR